MQNSNGNNDMGHDARPQYAGHVGPGSTNFEHVSVREPTFELVTSGSHADTELQYEISMPRDRKKHKTTSTDHIATAPNEATRETAAQIGHQKETRDGSQNEDVGAFPMDFPAPFRASHPPNAPRPSAVPAPLDVDTGNRVPVATLVTGEDWYNGLKLSILLKGFVIIAVTAVVMVVNLTPSPSPLTLSPTLHPMPSPTQSSTTLRPSSAPLTLSSSELSAETAAESQLTTSPTMMVSKSPTMNALKPAMVAFGNTYYGTETTSIAVVDRLLTGTIPTQLGQLTKLNFLQLASNELTGQIPSELGLLTELTYAVMSFNRFTGPIPSQLGLLSALTILGLGGNKLESTIPSELGLLMGLANFDLLSNQMTGSIPSELGQLTALASLDLSCNELTGTIPSELGKLTALKILWLQNNMFNGSVPIAVCSLDNMAALKRDCDPNPFPLECGCDDVCLCPLNNCIA